MNFSFPRGWSVLFADSSLDEEQWDRKEDLLQLHHTSLDRTIDVGWYQSEFAIFVFQGDFHGERLAEHRCSSQGDVVERLHHLLQEWGHGPSR